MQETFGTQSNQLPKKKRADTGTISPRPGRSQVDRLNTCRYFFILYFKEKNNMSDPIVEQLRQLNLSLRIQLEQAEARIPGINDLIEQLATIELVSETALLGLVIYEKHYSALNGPQDSGQVLQSVLMIPGGIGVICWDTEEYLAFRDHPPDDLSELFLKYVPFNSCVSAVKALLLPQVEPLMELLMKRFSHLNRELG